MYSYSTYFSFLGRVAKKSATTTVHSIAEEHDLAVHFFKEAKKIVTASLETYEDYREHIDGLYAVIEPIFEEADRLIELEEAADSQEINDLVVQFEKELEDSDPANSSSNQQGYFNVHAPYMPYDGI